MFYDELLNNGFITLPYPDDIRIAVGNVTGLWKQFCNLPDDTKQSIPYSNNSDGVGYERKVGTGPHADIKENFDITLLGKESLEQYLDTIDDSIVRTFVCSATGLVSDIRKTIFTFALELEKYFGIDGIYDEVVASELTFFVRFIHYFGNRNVGDETASAHVDQSGFTLHLFESNPGLQCLTSDREWIDMPVSPGQTVIIPSMQLQLRSKGLLKALCHRVIAIPETVHAGRYSAVCFVQLAQTPKYDKNKHGRLQEKSPGFNYTMTHEEFSKLFKM